MRTCSALAIAACLVALPAVAQNDTATLTGTVRNSTGVGVRGVFVELHSDKAPDHVYRTETDFAGMYHLAGVLADKYTLILQCPGFHRLTVKSIHISKGEWKPLPPLELTAGGVTDCGGYATLDHVRLIESLEHSGDLRGSVRREQWPLEREPLPGATVALICTPGKKCGAITTDANGEFLIRDVPPGGYSLRITLAGFYPLLEPGYKVLAGFESTFQSAHLERCYQGNCDPDLRPKKPIRICE